MSNTVVSFRISKSLLDLFDQTLKHQDRQNRSEAITDLIVKFISESGGDKASEKIKKELQKEIVKENIKKRIRVVRADLRKYKSFKKVQRVINEESFMVASAIYDQWADYYEVIEGKILQPPVDIKSL